MNKILIFLLFLIVITSFMVGSWLGVFYQTQKYAPQLANLATSTATLKTLTSKVIPSITAYGKVENISEKNITLTNNGESIAVDIASDAKVYSFIQQQQDLTKAQVAPISRVVKKISDIKKGDTINIQIKLLPNNQLLGNTIMIMPQ